MNRLFSLAFVFLFVSSGVLGQNALSKQNKIEALNSVLNFTNESAHGMLIVHRMLENYNQDVNQYVDLESFKINFYTNKDLPKNIFEDPENWFYDTSPYEWYDKAIQQSTSSKYRGSREIIEEMTSMKSIITKINNLRFDLDNAIIDKDLTDTVNLNIVYGKLEEGVDLYDAFYTKYKILLGKINIAFKPLQPTISEVQYPKLYKAMVDLYLTSRTILISLRNKEDDNIAEQIAAQQKALNVFKAVDFNSFGSSRLTSKKAARIKSNIIEQANQSIASAKKFYETAEVDKEYKQYGKFYFYHNSEVINKFNRYGNGMVFELNSLIDYLGLPLLKFTEMPHYFKVIYPKKLEKVDHLAATDSRITRLPTKLKDREIQMSTRKIKVDSLKFEVALYDHMIEDGDVISLNFNGDWIVEELLLTSKKKKLKLMLNSEGKNFFILHANNVGRRPPNTMAVDYYYRGFKKQIILKSDLDVSEMIEIEFVQSN